MVVVVDPSALVAVWLVPSSAASGSLEADEWEEGPGPVGAALAYPELTFVAVVFAAAAIFFGIFPSPLFHLASHAANALTGLF